MQSTKWIYLHKDYALKQSDFSFILFYIIKILE